MSSTITNEQPMSKRQRIDSVGMVKQTDSDKKVPPPIQCAFVSVTNGGDKHLTSNTNNAPPDILPATTIYGNSNTISANKIEMFSSNSAIIVSSTQPRQSTTTIPEHFDQTSDELDNAAGAMLKQIETRNVTTENGIHLDGGEFPDLLKTSSNLPAIISATESIPILVSQNASISLTASTSSTASSSLSSADATSSDYSRTILPIPSCSNGNSSSSNSNINSINNTNETSIGHSSSFSSANNLDEFQLHLMKQCLCDISERLLRRPFESHYYKDGNGIKHSVPLNDWPSHKLIHFLSNIQFLFDIYLKQNARGQICTRIMNVCDALLCNEQNIIDEIFQLYEYTNKFVQFLAGRVVASCMVIAKDKKDLYESWLTTLVANLVIQHDAGDYAALRKITFSLEIILRILEWRDFEEHPLEDTVVIDGRAVDTDDENFTLPLVVPPIENNYFAVHYNAENGSSTTLPSTSSASPTVALRFDDRRTEQIEDTEPSTASSSSERTANTPKTAPLCHLQTLFDSESFDTTDLKSNIVCALKTRWSYLVGNMSECIALLRRNRNFEIAENTILTFLTLWERIISVQSNLSIDSVLPFYEKLTTFEEILIKGDLPVPIYKQILTLFNESLCYGTTLALQPEDIPEETNRLANEIFNSVKSQRIFTSLPVQQTEPENDISFIGYKRPTIVYPIRGHSFANDSGDDDEDDDNGDLDSHQMMSDGESMNENVNKSIDYILLQKLVLLILKAIAVTVKPVRGDDSSDSSLDGCSSNNSTDYEAYQATIQIERATRDVVKKLNQFMKTKLNHHPQTHFSKMIVHLFADQDDYLIEAMLCMLDTTTAFLPRQPFGSSNASGSGLTIGRNQFRVLIDMLSPVYTFLEFIDLIANKTELLLDYLVSNETCFLLYLLRFLKYIRSDWQTFLSRCNDWGGSTDAASSSNRLDDSRSVLDRVMTVLIRLRTQIDRLVLQSLYPYNISPVTRLLQQCESLYEGNDHDLF